MDATLLVTLLAKPLMKEVLKEIVKTQAVLLKDLVNRIPQGKSEVTKALSELKRAELIKERQAPLDDFNTYYVTAEGLQAHSRLRGLE